MTERNLDLDNAQTALCDAKTLLCSVERDIQELELTRKRIENQFQEARDNRHGVFHLDTAIHQQSVDDLVCDVRAHQRRVEAGHTDVRDLTVYINSPGGSIIDGWHLIDELEQIKEAGFTLTAKVRGMAASMAAVFLQVFDRRLMGRHAEVMIHRALFGAIGKAYEIEDQVEFVRKQEAKIVNLFAQASGKDPAVFYELFAQRKDIWMGLDEAIALGVVDGEG